jgi:hypothetical protein
MFVWSLVCTQKLTQRGFCSQVSVQMAVRLSAAREAMRPRVPQPAMRGSGARRNTAARKRTVRTPASEEPQRGAPLTLDMLLTTLLAIVGIIGGTVAIINPSLNAVKTELTASIKELTISNSAKLDSISKDVASINSKLDALSASVQ